MNTRVVQKAVLQNPSGEILLLRRSKTDTRRPLEWDFPGGLLDEGEDLEACINREIKEETNLTATDLQPVYSKTEVRTWEYEGKELTENVIFIFYTGKVGDKEPELSFEHDQFKWLKPQEALKEIEYYLHKEVLKHILENNLLWLIDKR